MSWLKRRQIYILLFLSTILPLGCDASRSSVAIEIKPATEALHASRIGRNGGDVEIWRGDSLIVLHRDHQALLAAIIDCISSGDISREDAGRFAEEAEIAMKAREARIRSWSDGFMAALVETTSVKLPEILAPQSSDYYAAMIRNGKFDAALAAWGIE